MNALRKPELNEIGEQLTPVRSPSLAFRWTYFIPIVCFVVVISFAWGVMQGLKRPTSVAVAAATLTGTVSLEEMWPSQYRIPEGLAIRPFGKDIAVNGQEAYVVSFSTNNPIKALLSEQTKIWEADGYKTIGIAGAKRGTVVAYDKARDVHLSMNAWTALPSTPGWFRGGRSIQGVISAHTKNRATFALDEEFNQQIPEIPLPSQTEKGAVFSSTDRGQRTYTSTFKVPLRIEDARFFFNQEMSKDGWRIQNGLRTEKGQADSSMLFSKGLREATFLFVPERGNREATAVTLILTPRMLLGDA